MECNPIHQWINGLLKINLDSVSGKGINVDYNVEWAWDTFAGASQVAMQSTKVALELVRDAWDLQPSCGQSIVTALWEELATGYYILCIFYY